MPAYQRVRRSADRCEVDAPEIVAEEESVLQYAVAERKQQLVGIRVVRRVRRIGSHELAVWFEFDVPPVGRIQTRRPARENLCGDRKSTRLNSSHSQISYAVFCLKK